MQRPLFIRELFPNLAALELRAEGGAEWEGLVANWALIRRLDLDVVRDATVTALESALAVDLAPLMIDAWTEIQAVRAALADHEHRHVVPLAQHRLIANHDPSVELLFNGESVATLHVHATVELEVSGGILVIEGGAVRELRLARLSGSAALALEGREILRQDLGAVDLPGSVAFATESPPRVANETSRAIPWG